MVTSAATESPGWSLTSSRRPRVTGGLAPTGLKTAPPEMVSASHEEWTLQDATWDLQAILLQAKKSLAVEDGASYGC